MNHDSTKTLNCSNSNARARTAQRAPRKIIPINRATSNIRHNSDKFKWPLYSLQMASEVSFDLGVRSGGLNYLCDPV